MPDVAVIEHPLVADALARIRDCATPPAAFRALCHDVSVFLAYEALRDLPTIETRVTTPLVPTVARTLAQPVPAVVGILRAGLVMIEAVLSLLPDAPVGHLGMYRDHTTHQPVDYLSRLPPDIDRRPVLLVDPMLATGGSAVRALDHLRAAGALSIKLLCIVGCPEGVAAVHENHPDVPITLAALDERLNDHAYIVPGLGDAGDRIYGTV